MYQEVEEWLDKTLYKDKEQKVKDLAKIIRDIPDFNEAWDDNLDLEKNLDNRILELADIALCLRLCGKYE